MIQRQYERYGIVEVFSLIQQCLPMKCSEVFVEIYGEEIQRSSTRTVCSNIMTVRVVVKVSCLRRIGSDLFVATGISRDEEHRHTFDLDFRRLARSSKAQRLAYPGVIVYAPLPIEIECVFICKPGMFRVEIVELQVGGSHVRHDAPLSVHLPSQK